MSGTRSCFRTTPWVGTVQASMNSSLTATNKGQFKPSIAYLRSNGIAWQNLREILKPSRKQLKFGFKPVRILIAPVGHPVVCIEPSHFGTLDELASTDSGMRSAECRAEDMRATRRKKRRARRRKIGDLKLLM